MAVKANNQRADRGANRKAGNAPRLTAEQKRTALAKELGIKPKTKELVDMLLENKGLTQTEAYMKLHPKANYNTAKDAASKILQKPAVIGYKSSAVGKAKRRIITLVDSSNESIALKASQDIIDRNEGKSVQKTENLSRTVEVKLDLTGVRTGAHHVLIDQ
jgi:hypothetical protein